MNRVKRLLLAFIVVVILCVLAWHGKNNSIRVQPGPQLNPGSSVSM